MKLKEMKKQELYRLIKELRYNKGLSIQELAKKVGKSKRTIYRWLKRVKKPPDTDQCTKDENRGRPKEYSEEIFDEIRRIKEEVPQRSAPLVKRILKQKFPSNCPSLTTIRRFLREQGLSNADTTPRCGYHRFARERPNELWQIDIAGVQTVAHLEKLYLIALLDDSSRFIVGARYFPSQKSINVIKVLRSAIVKYGRPREILADNGAQFKSILEGLGTKYTRLLEHLGIKPIFARPRHPQTKGKLERWFGTVRQMFLVEARHTFKQNPNYSLRDFNRMFHKWVRWYNTKKKHRGLPENDPPSEIYLDREKRIYRPLECSINWDKWLYHSSQRKVSKYNEISYKTQKFEIPPGYSGSRVKIIEYEDKIDVFYRDDLIISHPYKPTVESLKKQKKTRKITHNGTIGYNGTHYYIDYKLSGKTVKIQEANLGKELLIYLNGVLLKKIRK